MAAGAEASGFSVEAVLREAVEGALPKREQRRRSHAVAAATAADALQRKRVLKRPQLAAAVGGGEFGTGDTKRIREAEDADASASRPPPSPPPPPPPSPRAKARLPEPATPPTQPKRARLDRSRLFAEQ
jgi:hypothetical protein